MDFFYPPEIREIREIVWRFVEEKVVPRTREMEEKDEIPEDLLKEAVALGLLGMSIPEAYGGLGLNPLQRTAVNEMLGRGPFGFASTISVHTGIGCIGIVLYGTEEQKSRYLPRMARGECFGAFALTEPDSGTDVPRMRTRAVRRGDRWILNGRKTFITNGRRAGVITTFARTSGTDGDPRGISAFLVEPGFPGFSVGQVFRTTGHKGGEIAELVFEDCEVPEENLLGQEGEGLLNAYRILGFGRTFVGARCVGGAQKALEIALRYAEERQSFGKPLADHEIIQAYLAEASTLVESARLLVYRSAWRLNQGLDAIKESSQAKLFASEALNKVVDRAIQILGGLSYIQGETEIERLYRDARIARIYDGASEIQKLVIFRQLRRGRIESRESL
jgi:acyl-CoA dehydrogenase